MRVSRGTAGEEAQKTLRRLQTSPRWTAALSGATSQPPVLVQRLDRDDSYYYIVEYRRHDAPTARIIVDGTTGEYLEAKGIEYDGESLSPFKEPDVPPVVQGKAALKRQPARMPSDRARALRPGLAGEPGEQPVLFWRPCRESMSPFMPFYRLSVNGEFLYIRVDGAHFKKLHTGPV